MPVEVLRLTGRRGFLDQFQRLYLRVRRHFRGNRVDRKTDHFLDRITVYGSGRVIDLNQGAVRHIYDKDTLTHGAKNGSEAFLARTKFFLNAQALGDVLTRTEAAGEPASLISQDSVVPRNRSFLAYPGQHSVGVILNARVLAGHQPAKSKAHRVAQALRSETINPRLANDVRGLVISENAAPVTVDQSDGPVLVEHKDHDTGDVQIALRRIAFPDDFLFRYRNAPLQHAIYDSCFDCVLNIGRGQTGFRDIVLRAFAHRGDGNFLVALPRQHHHRHERVPCADTLQDLNTVAPRQRVVQQNASGDHLANRGQPVVAVARLDDIVGCADAFAQETLVEKAVVLAVIDNQYSYRVSHFRLPWEARQFRTNTP